MESEFTRVVDALPGLVWTALPDGSIDFLNQRWYEYTGAVLDEGCGAEWQAAIHPNDLPEVLERWRSILASGEPRDMEARLRRYDGEFRWLLFRAYPLADASGQVVKWCGTGTDIDERKRAEDNLHDCLGPDSSVVDNLPALVVGMMPTGEVENVNREVLKYFGVTLEQLKGGAATDKPAPSFPIHPDDAPAVSAAWQHSRETGEPYDVEGRIRRADGVYRWFHMRAVPYRDGESRVIRWNALLTDIDDRKRSEALLADEKRLLEMVAGGYSLSQILEALCKLVESTDDDSYCSVLLIDQSGTRLEKGAAPSLATSFIDSTVGRPVTVESGPCATAIYLNERIVSPDFILETRWVASKWLEMALEHGLRACWSTPIPSTTGKILGAFAIYYNKPKTPTQHHQALIDRFTHIASIAVERAQNDAALKRSEAFLREAQHLSRTGSFYWRVDTDESVWSDETYRIYEIDPRVPLTRELIEERTHPEDFSKRREVFDKMIREGGDFELDHRLLLPNADGSIKHVHVVAHGTRDLNGHLVVLGAVQDITERRYWENAREKARAELAHVSRVTALGALTASIAHEVNQPLSGIITNASTCLRMLADDPPNIEGARETARRTIRDGHRASDVVTRLRTLFAKRDSVMESVDLNEATREVIALSWHELQKIRVALQTELAEDLPPVTGDRVQLQQVILNLFLNASDAMSGVESSSRRLVIRTERDGDDLVRLSVQDSGLGLDLQSVDKLFEAFYTTKSGGMGIGLSVSRCIIENHHGRLWAESNDGPGATFSFSIPIEAGNPVAVDTAQSMSDS